MNRIISTLSLFLFISVLAGQTTFIEHPISTSADGALSVYAADVDGDGDMDVLSASLGDPKIAWYENDGSESFTEHAISTSANGAYSVYAADVDSDGDMDVLSVSSNDNKIAWYENDGSESFTEHAISTSADGANSVYAADVDGDGDMDVLSASWGDPKIAWYENDGSESFTEHAISTSANYAYSVYAADVDGDGDMDVLSASWGDDKIAWYEQEGSLVQTTSVYVSITGDDSTGDGSEENPFATIQHGIESTSDGDTVLVAVGTYVENINFNGKNIMVTSIEGSEGTIIDGSGNEERVVTFSGGEDSTATLNGFTITSGDGGIWCSGNSSPVISNNVIKENVEFNGGGIYISARTENGINNPLVVDNMIINNIAVQYENNPGWTGKGGGVYCGHSSEAVFKNNVIANNHSEGQSGGIEFWISEVNLINNTIVNNSSDGTVGGVWAHYPPHTDVVNTIIRGNSPGHQISIDCSWAGGNPTVISYSNIEGGIDGAGQYGPECELVWGDGNIDAEPNFCSYFTGDYHLAEGSSCIGSGLDGANMGALDVGCEFPQFPEPEIMSVMDVPEDQGGRVYVEFSSSMFDHPEGTNQSYTIFRMDVLEDSSAWVVVASGAAIGDPSYTYEVATLRDSTADNDGMTEFKVVASMNEGNFHSEPAMGYSVDNIAPGVPTGLMATADDVGIQLTWDLSPDEDFQYFTLEKSFDADFTEFESFETIDTSFTDMEYELNQTYFYRIVSVDHAGNISDYSETVEGAVLSIDSNQIPEVFALHQNYPNPFNPMTRISYDLPEDAMVSITIFDIMGRSIRSLVNSKQTAGYRSIRWDATNNIGEPVSAGMYIYSIQAGEFRQVRKMILLK